jgi:hypothetical protein
MIGGGGPHPAVAGQARGPSRWATFGRLGRGENGARLGLPGARRRAGSGRYQGRVLAGDHRLQAGFGLVVVPQYVQQPVCE